MKLKNKAFWIIYLFFLITIVLVFWVVILNKQSYFEKNMEFTRIQDILSKNILTNSSLSLSYHKENNSNSWIYVPFLSCPEEVKYFSWSELISTGKTIFYQNYCSWTLKNSTLNLFYNWTYSNFSSWTLWLDNFNLYWTNYLTWDINLNDKISFEKSNIFDDRFVKARTEINWIILKNTWFNNIFWINDEIRSFIDKNTNNIWNFLNISKVGSWIIYLDINDTFSWKIVEFDKSLFNIENKLLKINELNFWSDGWILGYLQNDLSFSWTIWDPKIFDFKNKDYALFLSYNTWSLDDIRYNLKVYTDTWSWVYINPIKDDSDKIEYLWNNILINNWIFLNKIYKIIDYK